jgi:hypothetical protein
MPPDSPHNWAPVAFASQMVSATRKCASRSPLYSQNEGLEVDVTLLLPVRSHVRLVSGDHKQQHLKVVALPGDLVDQARNVEQDRPLDRSQGEAFDFVVKVVDQLLRDVVVVVVVVFSREKLSIHAIGCKIVQ